MPHQMEMDKLAAEARHEISNRDAEIRVLRKTLKEARQFIDEHCMAPEANSIIRTIDAVVA